MSATASKKRINDAEACVVPVWVCDSIMMPLSKGRFIDTCNVSSAYSCRVYSMWITQFWACLSLVRSRMGCKPLVLSK